MGCMAIGSLRDLYIQSAWKQDKFVSRKHWCKRAANVKLAFGFTKWDSGAFYARAEQVKRLIQISRGGDVLGVSEGDKMRGRNIVSGKYQACDEAHHDVAGMEDYNVEATAATMSITVIENLVSGLDRAELLNLLNLDLDWPLVTDIKGVHPPSLTAPNTLKIFAEDCPFLDAGTSSECCTGCVIWRTGHSTVCVPCFRTDILEDNSVCAHCEQLWAAPNESGFYVLNPETMDKAAEFYKPGKTGVMKKWQELIGASGIYEDEVQSAKDIFADSSDELDPDFPGMDFTAFCKEILNYSGVLFADAGRVRNPYRRTYEQQLRIGQYVQRMSVLWVRLKAAVKKPLFAEFVEKLRAIALRVEQATRWTVQKAFPKYPVFVGPLVCADIMLAGFQLAGARYDHQVGRVMQNSQEERIESAVQVGPAIERLDKWAKTVVQVKRVSPVKRKGTVRKTKATSATPLWDAAATSAADVARDLNTDFSTPAAQVETKRTEREAAAAGAEESTRPARTVGKKMFYGVARGFKPGVYASWEEANTQVKNFSGHRVKKFNSRLAAEHYVAEVGEKEKTLWYVLKNSRRDGAYDSEAAASLWRCYGSTLVQRSSLSAAKRFLGKTRIRVYRGEAGTLSTGSGDAAAAENPKGAGQRLQVLNERRQMLVRLYNFLRVKADQRMACTHLCKKYWQR